MKTYICSFVSWAILIIALSSCMTPAQMQLQSSNPQARVELLFEVDGCKVYRFYDGSSPRYFTKCKDSSNSSVGWLQSCGKNCVYYAENVTSYPKNGIPIKP